jgi:hypothetical protein
MINRKALLALGREFGVWVFGLEAPSRAKKHWDGFIIFSAVGLN